MADLHLRFTVSHIMREGDYVSVSLRSCAQDRRDGEIAVASSKPFRPFQAMIPIAWKDMVDTLYRAMLSGEEMNFDYRDPTMNRPAPLCQRCHNEPLD